MAISLGSRFSLRVVWALAIVVVILGELLPPTAAPIRMVIEVPDKVVHAGAYWLLALIPALHERRSAAGLAAVALIALGVALEYLQRWMGLGRMFEVLDMVANAVGVAGGLASGLLLRPVVVVRERAERGRCRAAGRESG